MEDISNDLNLEDRQASIASLETIEEDRVEAEAAASEEVIATEAIKGAGKPIRRTRRDLHRGSG